MPNSVLIDPTNRLLGWSTSDFSLYGGQPSVTIGAPAAPAAGEPGLTVPAPGRADESLVTSVPAHDDGAQPIHEFSGGSASSLPVAALAPTATLAPEAPSFHAAAPEATLFSPQVPAAVGSSSIEGIAAPASALSAPQSNAGDSHLAGTSSVSGFTAPLFGLVAPGLDVAALASHDLATGLSAPVLALDHTIGDTLTATAGIVTATLAETHDLTDTLSGILDGALDHNPITAADGFAGSDPAAGVTTLVSMVDSADAFDLAHAGVDTPGISSGGSIIDSLASDTLAGPLLGDADGHHAGGGHIPDHDHGALGIL